MLVANPIYQNDLKQVAEAIRNLQINQKTFLVLGATGLIGRFLVDVILQANHDFDLNNQVVAVGRNAEKLTAIHTQHKHDAALVTVVADINDGIPMNIASDYVLQAASNTHPNAYATDPIGTIMTNVMGTKNVLDYAVAQHVERVILFSSVEIYGANRGDVEYFNEAYLGDLDSNTLRAGYSEAKRVSESLSQAYIEKYGLDIVIARISRVFGPTVALNDSKASTQFIVNAVKGEPIVLKSKGDQLFSYGYVADIASGLLHLLKHGEKGEAYNLKGLDSDVTLRQFAETAAQVVGSQVVFELPNAVEQKGFSTAKVALLDDQKIRALNWQPKFDFKVAVEQTIRILKDEI